MYMFSANDIEQIRTRGASLAQVEQQIESFKKGFPFVELVDISTISKGVLVINKEDAGMLAAAYNSHIKGRKILKFVPASGAASRMFKDLLAFLNAPQEAKKEVLDFFANIKVYAFYNDLKEALAKDKLKIEELLLEKQYSVIADYLLNSKGLNYAALPKGLLKFHRYNDHVRAAVEEHLVEGASYACNDKGEVHLHFTVSAEHKELFIQLVDAVKTRYEKEYNVNYFISYSVQLPATDTIAVDMQNMPFREKDGSLLFRPGGHGALIENLNNLKGDIIFIKNIDNVVPDRLKPETYLFKKAIGGILLQTQEQIHAYLKELENSGIADIQLNTMAAALEKDFEIKVPAGFEKLTANEKKMLLHQLLNKPIRICGVVKNEGEPGGGPFLVKNTKGDISLQIVESAQIDLDNASQKGIFDRSTHFNPVDLVCAVRDYKGQAFDLKEYIDPEAGFISYKSKDGKDLKAMELPGLWNGAMANWITLFVEVPISTFNPVKTVFDLARDAHRAV